MQESKKTRSKNLIINFIIVSNNTFLFIHSKFLGQNSIFYSWMGNKSKFKAATYDTYAASVTSLSKIV